MHKNPDYKSPNMSLFRQHDATHGRDGKFIRISKEELRDLVVKAQQGDKNATDAVCREVYRFVLKRVAGFKRRGIETMEPDDLFQAGMRGVLRAIERFEFDRGFSFLTYLTAWVDQAIDREFQNTFSHVRVPVHIWGSYRELTSAYRELMKDRRVGDIDDYEVSVPRDVLVEAALKRAKELGRTSVSKDTLESAYQFLLKGGASVFLNLDHPARDFDDGDTGTTLGDVIEDRSLKSTDDIISAEQVSQSSRDLLKYIDRRTRYVLMRRFGIGADTEGLTLEDVGCELGVTRERIRQIEAVGIRILKRLMLVGRNMSPEELMMDAKRIIGRRTPKPFVIPEFVELTEIEEEIMNFDIFKGDTPYNAPPGRQRFPGARYKGRVVPDWFDHSQIRAMGVRKQLQDHEMNPHELLVRYKLYGKRELTQDQVLETCNQGVWNGTETL